MTADALRDEARWMEAQSLLDRTPTESAQQRLERWRRLRGLYAATALLLAVALAGVLLVLLRDVSTRASEVPTWQTVVGLAISSAGLALDVFGVVMLWRASRRLQTWRSPLAVLTRAQRKKLLAQARGLKPVEPARVPMIRLLAEQLMNVRNLMIANVGLGIIWVGQWIAFPSTWRALIALGFGLLLGVGWPLVERDARRARQFVEEHPLVNE